MDLEANPVVLVTGGCGFIGSNFVRFLVRERPRWQIVNVDALTYAGNLANLRDIDGREGYRFVRGDIADREFIAKLFGDLARVDLVVNFAAESHVDRSILGPDAFVRTNIHGTFTLLDEVRRRGRTRFVQISTDEVYGSLGPTGRFTEQTPLDPSSPYSASKASADLLVAAYHRTFGLDAVITRCSNNYGPYQFPEKLIPLMVINSMQGKPLPVYGKGLNVRDWIHVRDHCRGILAACERGTAGEVYNFGGESERANIDIVQFIADKVSGHRDGIRFVQDRPGHDLRYAMEIAKARQKLGWQPLETFEAGLEETIAWYRENTPWWQAVLSQEYQRYYQQWYGERVPRSAGGAA